MSVQEGGTIRWDGAGSQLRSQGRLGDTGGPGFEGGADGIGTRGHLHRN